TYRPPIDFIRQGYVEELYQTMLSTEHLLLYLCEKQETESAETKDGDEEDAFLTTLAMEYSADDKTSSPVSTQLADIVNKRWSSKLSDDKFKEKIAKYDRPENCERLFAPKSAQLLMNARQTGGIRRHEGGENNTMNEVLTLQVDALALLGHTNYDLSLRRRETMKPSLNKEPQPALVEQQIPQSSEKAGRGQQVQQEVTAIDKDIIYTHLSKVKWEKITSDREILDIVSGQRIEFDTMPLQNYPRSLSKCTEAEQAVIRAEIVKLLHKAVIVHHVEYHHFKMETLIDAIRLMTPNCFMASVDLKDAYYSVPIAKPHQKYLKFAWEGSLYAFTCFPNGLASCPRKFTKLLKPVYAVLRKLGHISSPYIDDSYLQGDDYESCWGCTLGETRTGGNWTKDEAQHHINYLELLAVFLALKTFANSLAGKHVKVMIDNMTALSDINHMGTSKSDLRNALSKSMWLWCRARHIWLTAVHIPGVENVEADHQSRITNTSAEWSLNKQIFYDAISRLGNFTESPGGTVHCCCGNPKMANSDMVAKTNESTNSSTNTITKNKDDTDPPEQSGSNTSTVSASRANNLPLVWKSLEEQGISAGASNIIVQSWRQGTAKQYRSYLQKWELYCNKRKIDPIHPTISDGINFLSSLYESGVGYSAINTARSALSSILLLPGNVSFGSHPLATRLLKGVFELRPSLPKYQDTWDISVVIIYVKLQLTGSP
ncbi:Enzymatic poly, partial [Paramuricea clavata]